VKLTYFKSIPSQNKIYNKVLAPNTTYKKKLNFRVLQAELDNYLEGMG